MPNILDYFRMQNIFGGQNAQNQNQGVINRPQPADESQPPVEPRFPYYTPPFAGYTNEPTPAMDRFRNMLDTMPERHRPSIMRMIGTGALSFANAQQPDQVSESTDKYGNVSRTVKKGNWQPYGLEETNKILQQPYEQELGDWANRAKVTQQAAQLERQSNADRALQAQRYATAGIIPEREARLGAQGRTRLEQGQERIDINRSKQKLADWKAHNPDGKIYAPKGGNVVIINPQTGEATDTGIESGMLSDEERINLTGQKRMEQISKQGEIQKGIQGTKGEQALEQIGARGGEARETKEVVPGGAGATSQLPTQQKVGLQLKANKAKQEHPEWSRYINTDPNTGMVEITPPATGYFSRGPDKAVYDEIIKYMGAAPTQPTKPKTTTPAATEAGRVKIADASGKVVATIPIGDVARLNKAKYHVVK